MANESCFLLDGDNKRIKSIKTKSMENGSTGVLGNNKNTITNVKIKYIKTGYHYVIRY